ncbi:MAG: phosphonopyruvate decarboxylase [Acidimicrobiales bacterium]
MTESVAPAEPAWVAPTHRALTDAGVRIVGSVPDGGLRHLLVRLDTDPAITTVRLTTEEEGVALACGAWLGGSRAALLMQSSGVGNCINMLGLLSSCRIPALLVVTMRGQADETNPWQVPMGSVAGDALRLMGIDVRTVVTSDGVPGAVARALADAFGPHGSTDRGGGATAVLIDQRIIGVKMFEGDR